MKTTLKVLAMNDNLFIQRRRVINALYFTRDCFNKQLPYIKVRIVDYTDKANAKYKTLGLCFINKDYITISSDLIKWNDDKLNTIVSHELIHAYIGEISSDTDKYHNEKCPLMKSTYTRALSTTEIKTILKGYTR